jgi:hypothetical protein
LCLSVFAYFIYSINVERIMPVIFCPKAPVAAGITTTVPSAPLVSGRKSYSSTNNVEQA